MGRKGISQIRSQKFGEHLVCHYLSLMGEDPLNIADEQLPFDILINKPYSNIFSKKSVIEVKTLKTKSGMDSKIRHNIKWTYVKKLPLKLKNVGFDNYEPWIALIVYGIQKDRSYIKCCGLPVKILNKDSDFEHSHNRYNVLFGKAWKKALFKFRTTYPKHWKKHYNK